MKFPAPQGIESYCLPGKGGLGLRTRRSLVPPYPINLFQSCKKRYSIAVKIDVVPRWAGEFDILGRGGEGQTLSFG